MKIAKFIWLIVIVASIGCKGELDTCKKYFQKKYLIANLEHEKLFDEDKLEEAIATVEKFIERDSNNYVAINYIGAYKYSLCKRKGCTLEELKEVYDLYKESIELCNDYRIGYFNIIEILAEMSKTKYENDYEIVEYLEYYNSKWKKRSNLLTKGGEAKFRLGEIEESLNYLNEAIELDSSEAMAYIFKGKCFTSRKEWNKAMESLNIGLSIDSLSLGFHERGYVNKEMGNIDEAIQDYQMAISIYDERFESYVGLGQIEINRNNVDLACQYFKKAEELKENSETVKKWLNKYCEE
jgi:tetratricopeptide (TPR) repeat protein